jgi:DNA-binding transcriptional MerR regulator
MVTGFPTGQAARLTGLTRRQLAYWDRTGLFRPSLVRAQGRGTPRVYSFLDLVQLRVAKRLLDAGLSARKLRACLTYLRENISGGALAPKSFVVAGPDALMLTSDPSIAVNIAKRGQMVWLIGLEAVACELEEAVAKDARGSKARPAA